MFVSTLVLGPLCLCLPWSLVHYERVSLDPWSTMIVSTLIRGPLWSFTPWSLVHYGRLHLEPRAVKRCTG